MNVYKELLYGPITNFPTALLIVIIVWSLFWKGLALWRAARGNQKYWFVALLVLNTAGLLEIAYMAFFQKKRK